jgi:hypothetical protein
MLEFLPHWESITAGESKVFGSHPDLIENIDITLVTDLELLLQGFTSIHS